MSSETSAPNLYIRPVPQYPGRSHVRVTSTTTVSVVQSVVRDPIITIQQRQPTREGEKPQQWRNTSHSSAVQSVARDPINAIRQSRKEEEKPQQWRSASNSSAVQSVARDPITTMQQSRREEEQPHSSDTTIARPIGNPSRKQIRERERIKNLTQDGQFIKVTCEYCYTVFIPEQFHRYQEQHQDLFCLPEDRTGCIRRAVTVQACSKRFLAEKFGWPWEVSSSDDLSVIRDRKRAVLNKLFKRWDVVLAEDSNRFMYENKRFIRGRVCRIMEGRVVWNQTMAYIVTVMYTENAALGCQAQKILGSFKQL